MKTVLNCGSSVHGRTARPGGMQIDQAAQEPSNRTLQGRSPCTAPESGLNRPPSTRSRVDLPQPLAPSSMWKEPRGTSRQAASSTCCRTCVAGSRGQQQIMPGSRG